jgi:hypothetical protein
VAEQGCAGDCLQPTLRCGFRQRLRPGVIAPRKLGVSCRVKVPVGSGRATHPYRVLRSWRSQGLDPGEQEGRSVDRASCRPQGEPRPLKCWDSFDMAIADAEGFHAHRRQYKTIREGEDGKVRRSPQAVAGRKRGVEARGRPQTLLPMSSNGVWSTAPEARQGKPGHGTMLEPARRWGPWWEAGGEVLATGTPAGCAWGVVSSLGRGGGESPRQGAGLDGSTPPGKDTHPGHVGPEQHEPTSLRAIANRV